MSTLEEKQQKRLENFLLKQEEKKLKQKLKKKKKRKKKKIIKEEKKPIIKKKKVGRPKKRGPKKKRIRRKIVKTIKKRPVIDFKIISTLNGKQNGYIGCYKTYADAYTDLPGQELYLSYNLSDLVIFYYNFATLDRMNRCQQNLFFKH